MYVRTHGRSCLEEEVSRWIYRNIGVVTKVRFPTESPLLLTDWGRRRGLRRRPGGGSGGTSSPLLVVHGGLLHLDFPRRRRRRLLLRTLLLRRHLLPAPVAVQETLGGQFRRRGRWRRLPTPGFWRSTAAAEEQQLGGWAGAGAGPAAGGPGRGRGHRRRIASWGGGDGGEVDAAAEAHAEMAFRARL